MNGAVVVGRHLLVFRYKHLFRNRKEFKESRLIIDHAGGSARGSIAQCNGSVETRVFFLFAHLNSKFSSSSFYSLS